MIEYLKEDQQVLLERRLIRSDVDDAEARRLRPVAGLAHDARHAIEVEWQELGQPELTDAAASNDVQLENLELDGAVAPQAIQLTKTAKRTDLVVALDTSAFIW